MTDAEDGQSLPARHARLQAALTMLDDPNHEAESYEDYHHARTLGMASKRIDELFALYESANARVDDLETEAGVLRSRVDELERVVRRAR